VDIDLVISQREMVGQVEVGVILWVKPPAWQLLGFAVSRKVLVDYFSPSVV